MQGKWVCPAYCLFIIWGLLRNITAPSGFWSYAVVWASRPFFLCKQFLQSTSWKIELAKIDDWLVMYRAVMTSAVAWETAARKTTCVVDNHSTGTLYWETIELPAGRVRVSGRAAGREWGGGLWRFHHLKSSMTWLGQPEWGGSFQIDILWLLPRSGTETCLTLWVLVVFFPSCNE